MQGLFTSRRALRAQVRRHADKALDVLLASFPEQSGAVQELKFKTFNQEWLQVIERALSGDDDLEPLGAAAPEAGGEVAGPRTLLGLYDDDDDEENDDGGGSERGQAHEVRLIDVPGASPTSGGGASGGFAPASRDVDLPAELSSESGSGEEPEYV